MPKQCKQMLPFAYLLPVPVIFLRYVMAYFGDIPLFVTSYQMQYATIEFGWNINFIICFKVFPAIGV